ncbi:MAG: putative aminotransferase [Acidimicrobiaceae bacterium]|nr:putative aminotransferase [Acidimicrobiaceae bacterium]
MTGMAPAPPLADPAEGRRVLELDRAHVFHSWSAQGSLNPLPIAGAAGSWFWDYDGNRYLDFSSQLVFTNIGHQHPRVVAAIQEQAGRLCTVAPQHANDARAEAARRVAELAPPGLEHVFFTNGGADGIENAIRMARLHTGRHKVITTYRSYHGNTAGAIVATGDPRRWANDVGVAGHVHVFGPYLYRSAFWAASEEQECERALAHLRQVVELEGPATIAAILLETIPGTAGVLVPPAGYLAGVRALCDEFGIVYIADEVMAGFGRAGEWFALDAWSVTPDLIVFAKGVNSGYVPLGGVVISEAVYQTFRERVFPGGLTYSGHPLACAAAVATMDLMKDEGIVEHARSIGLDVLGPGLRKLQERHEVVGEVRGTGVFWALDLVRDRSTREMLVPYNATGADNAPMAELAAACRSAGLMPFANFNRLHVLPPCNVSADEVETGLAILDEALGVIDKYYAGS